MSRPLVTPGSELVLHATTVAIDRKAVLIKGPSGSGKSGLALQLMALGARLVADDRTSLLRRNELILSCAPDTICGQIEARGIGILAAEPVADIPVHLIVDMGREETERLPPFREETILGVPVTMIKKCAAAHFPAAIKLYLHHDRVA